MRESWGMGVSIEGKTGQSEPAYERYRKYADELVEMAREDQSVRARWEETGEDWGESDSGRTERFRAIVDAMGWPTEEKVGKEASHAAYLLVQHADHDIDFQRRCLRLMKESSEECPEIAYLEDRVRVNSGESQWYGTQFDDDGVWFHVQPIEGIDANLSEDAEKLNTRRQNAGLSSFQASFAEYEQAYRAMKRKRLPEISRETLDFEVLPIPEVLIREERNHELMSCLLKSTRAPSRNDRICASER
jgi:hypothetical protein